MAITKVPSFKATIPWETSMLLALQTQDEGCAVQQDATVTLLLDGKPMLQVRAYIDRGKGADGNWYPVIKFREVESCP